MIMRRVNCSLDQVADVLNAMIPFESLEMYLENINKCFEDTLCFQNTYLHAFVISDEDIVENVFKKQRQEIIHQALDELRPREKEVLISRYGLVGGEEKTLEEVGMIYHVTRERIRQIESKAINKLRSKRALKDIRT